MMRWCLPSTTSSRQSRARHPQRLQHSAAFGLAGLAGMALKARVAVAHAARDRAHHLRQLCRGRARPPISRCSRGAWRRCSIRRCHGTMSTICARSGRGRSCLRVFFIRMEAKTAVEQRHRRAYRIEPWRPPARWGARQHRRACRPSSRPLRHAFRFCSMAASGAAATLSKPWRSALQPCLVGTAAAMGPGDCGRSGGRAYARHLSSRDRSRVMGLCGIARYRRYRTRPGVFSRSMDAAMIKDPPLLTIRRNFARPDARAYCRFRQCSDRPCRRCAWAGGAHSTIASSRWRRCAAVMVGMAITCHCGPADNLALFAALAAAQAGRYARVRRPTASPPHRSPATS